MYTVTVEGTFSATHRVTLANGDLEPQHGHDWKVCAHFAQPELDKHGMVVDFLVVQDALNEIISSWHHRDLNVHRDFADQNPTAEVVARIIFDALASRGLDSVNCVTVTEAPGCTASYTS